MTGIVNATSDLDLDVSIQNVASQELLLTNDARSVCGVPVAVAASVMARIIGANVAHEVELSDAQRTRVLSLLAAAAECVANAESGLVPGRFELFVHYHDAGGSLGSEGVPSILGVSRRNDSPGTWFITN